MTYGKTASNPPLPTTFWDGPQGLILAGRQPASVVVRPTILLGTNQNQGQRYNRRVIFDLVRMHGSLARTDLARQAGLSYQAVSNITDGLLEGGLLSEVRKRSGRRGRPPVELSINPDGAFSLGFFFDQRTLRGALVDLAGAPRAELEAALRSPEPSVVLPAIAAMAALPMFEETASDISLLLKSRGVEIRAQA